MHALAYITKEFQGICSSEMNLLMPVNLRCPLMNIQYANLRWIDPLESPNLTGDVLQNKQQLATYNVKQFINKHSKIHLMNYQS